MDQQQFLYKQDESIAEFMYILLEGSIQVFRNQKEVGEMVEAPCILGEAALLHSAVRTHSVLSLEKLKICTIHRNQFKELVKFVSPQHCAIAKQVIEQYKIFNLLEKKQQAILIQGISFVKFKRGSIIAREGEESNNLYIVNKGQIVSEVVGFQRNFISTLKTEPTQQLLMPVFNRNAKSVQQGENILLKSYQLGDILGFEGYIQQNASRLSRLRTTEDTECFAISRELLAKVLIGGEIDVNQIHDDQLIKELRTQLVYSIFENDEIMKTLGHEHRLAIIESMNFREFSAGEPVFFKFKEKNLKLAFCLKGRLVFQNNPNQVFLSQGQIFGAQEMYQSQAKKFQQQFEQNIIADPFCIMGEITRESIEQALGEEFYQVVQKNTIISYLKRIPLFSFLPFAKLEWISEAFQKQKFNINETIFQQDTQGTTLYIIHKGSVDFYKNNKKVLTLENGQFFEERSLFLNEYRTMTAVAAEQTTLYTLDKNDFASLVEANLRKFLNKRLKLTSSQVKLEDLILIEKCAQGSFKSVFEVEDRVSMNRFALKVVSRQNVKKYNLQNYLLNERTIQQSLDHPFVVRLIKTYKDQKRVFFLNEMVRGMDIFNELTLLQVFNKRECQFNLASLLLVIEYLHSNNIIHRDIKPENIFIDEEGYIKVLDLGTCKQIQDRTYTLVGTPAYTAPEIFLSIGYDYAADYWSLGICLYEFLCGTLPFGNGQSDPMSIFKDIIARQEIQFPEFLQDDQAKDLIKKLLLFSPEQRLTNPRKIKQHQWFENFDFDSLLCRMIQPPFVPKLEQYVSSYMLGGNSQLTQTGQKQKQQQARKRNGSVDSYEKMEQKFGVIDYLENNQDDQSDLSYSLSSFIGDEILSNQNNVNISNTNSPHPSPLIQSSSQQSFSFNMQQQQSQVVTWDRDF